MLGVGRVTGTHGENCIRAKTLRQLHLRRVLRPPTWAKWTFSKYSFNYVSLKIDSSFVNSRHREVFCLQVLLGERERQTAGGAVLSRPHIQYLLNSTSKHKAPF